MAQVRILLALSRALHCWIDENTPPVVEHWQTHLAQNQALARACAFESRLGDQTPCIQVARNRVASDRRL